MSKSKRKTGSVPPPGKVKLNETKIEDAKTPDIQKLYFIFYKTPGSDLIHAVKDFYRSREEALASAEWRNDRIIVMLPLQTSVVPSANE